MNNSASTQRLFETAQVGAWQFPQRLFMAPMTRARSLQPGAIPQQLNADYYAQRAAAALIISEATQISAQAQGYSFTPGIYSTAQTQGWRLVTTAVHQAGAKMIAQLWHVGRMSHPSLHQGALPVAPSALAPDASVWIWNQALQQGQMLACPVPRALTAREIQAIVQDYRHAAQQARLAGFDGIEIHAANGYLVDQFLRSSANVRQDDYGGSISKRCRFLFEILDAVAEVYPAQQIGVRISPFTTSRGMACPEIQATTLYLARELHQRGLAYLHLAEADWDDAPAIADAFRQQLRQQFQAAILVAGNYDLAKANWVLQQGYADMVGFGRAFIANPDLPQRLRQGLPLAEFDKTTLFGGGAKGYTDYPRHPESGA